MGERSVRLMDLLNRLRGDSLTRFIVTNIILIMGAACQETNKQSLEIINSFQEGFEQNMQTHSQQVPEKTYATRAEGVPKLNEEVAAILTAELQAQKIEKENLKGVELPPFLIHRKQIYYQGEWKNKIPHGKGKVYFSQGHYYEGYMNEGQADCRNGILIFNDGSYYRGGFQASQFSGKGKFTSKSGMVYEGEWLNSKPEGRGKQTFADGSLYQGDFVDGMKEGRGVFKWRDGRIYEGFFKDGKMNGKGRYYRGSEQFYDGQFTNNMKITPGQLHTAYGVYKGSFEDGQFSGKGEFRWNDGKTYVGDFKAGNLDGEGIITFTNGRRLKGVWKQGQNIELIQLSKTESPKKK